MAGKIWIVLFIEVTDANAMQTKGISDDND